MTCTRWSISRSTPVAAPTISLPCPLPRCSGPRLEGTLTLSGFDVSPDHDDSMTRHTPVVAEDVHFWAEVMLPSGDWLVIEPTPGYEC